MPNPELNFLFTTNPEIAFPRTNPLLDQLPQMEGPIAFVNEWTRNGLTVQIAQAGNLDPKTIASFAYTSAYAYLAECTMGEYPKEDPTKCQELIQTFYDDVQPSDYLVLVQKSDDSGIILGGCLVRPGRSTHTIGQLVGSAEGVGALAALIFTIPEANSEFANTPEIDTYNVSRLFHLPSEVFTKLGLDRRDMLHSLQETVVGIEAARTALELESGHHITWGFADTHTQAVIGLVHRFGWETITQYTTPTSAVLETSHGHHYRYYASPEEGRHITIIAGKSADQQPIIETLNKKLTEEHVKDTLEKGATSYAEFLNLLNTLKLPPQRFDLSTSVGQTEFRDFKSSHPNQIIHQDTRLTDVLAIFRRFHPQFKANNDSEVTKNPTFTEWLTSLGASFPFDNQGLILALPVASSLETGEIIWETMAVLPQTLVELGRRASAFTMMDSLDGQTRTSEILQHDVAALVIGLSVGSRFTAALGLTGNVSTIHMIDSDRRDPTGDARYHAGTLDLHEILKIIAMQHELLRANPYGDYNISPALFTTENAPELLSHYLPLLQAGKKVVIGEFCDDLEAKDLVRRLSRELFAEYPDQVLIVSAADIGRSRINMTIEHLRDEPYGGIALQYTNDPYANSGITNLENIPLDQLSPEQQATVIQGLRLAKLMAINGMIVPYLPEENLNLEVIATALNTTIDQLPEKIIITPELLYALDLMKTGQVSSFLQSGIATGLAGEASLTAIIAWLENSLTVTHLTLDPQTKLHLQANKPQLLIETYKQIMALQKSLQINPIKWQKN